MISLRNLSNPALVGRRIRELLEQEGPLTQTQLGTRIGVPRGTICKYLAALLDEGYVCIARKISYVKSGGSKGPRRGLTYLYARTGKPLPVLDEQRQQQLSASELHTFMASFVQRGTRS